MNQRITNQRKIEARYTVKIAIGNILDKSRVDFELYRPDMEGEEIFQIVEGSGFNSNYPYIKMLIYQIKRSFSLSEIVQFMGCLSSMELIEMKILPAVFRVSDPFMSDSEEKVVRIPVIKESFDFSTIEQYTLPFIIAGYYNPSQYN
jgi:hypothetical protein